MKTPERWRSLPRCALLVSILAQKWSKDVKMSRRDVTWRHDVVLSRHMTLGVLTKWFCAIYIGHTIEKVRKSRFFRMATLTFDLWPWPSNSSEILSRSIPTPNFRSVAQSVQPWECWLTDRHTHTQTDTPDRLYTLDRWRGREKLLYRIACLYTLVQLVIITSDCILYLLYSTTVNLTWKWKCT